MDATRRPRFMAFGCLLLSAVLGGDLLAREPESRPPSWFEGAVFPVPPKQHDPWEPPPAKVPQHLGFVTATLCDQGLADPRGCEYRAIEIRVGDVWGGAGNVVKTHGWVLPTAASDKSRFAIAWSGLIYPTLTIGEPVDLTTDVRSCVDRFRELVSKVPLVRGREIGATGEAATVSMDRLHPIRVCLLLRLGRPDLAEMMHKAGVPEAQRPEGALPEKTDQRGVQYVAIATDLAWLLFDRAVCAHMRGDDTIALADARLLTKLQRAVESTAEAMGVERPPLVSTINNGLRLGPYIGFLEQLPELLADHERRAREPKRKRLSNPAAAVKAHGNEQVAALIADLAQVKVEQHSQPGGVNLMESPVIEALIDCGPDAVEPLIDALERDNRLTRSARFHRDFFRSRVILSVGEAAYFALVAIFQKQLFAQGMVNIDLVIRKPEGRRAVANAIRQYWMKNREVPPAELWYLELADDNASRGDSWLQAADHIVGEANAKGVPESGSAYLNFGRSPGYKRPDQFAGEILRDGRKRSVSELMARRVADLDPVGLAQVPRIDEMRLHLANQMAVYLSVWDSEAAVPVLKVRSERAASAMRDLAPNAVRDASMELTRFTRLRLAAGDRDALLVYADAIRHITPQAFATMRTDLFEPMWNNAEHPAIERAAAALFDDSASDWNPSTAFKKGTVAESSLLTTPMLGVKPFRSMVLRALADKTRIARSQGEQESKASQEPARVADWVCEQLQPLEGTRLFERNWPVARRDQVIAETISYLERYGDRFQNDEFARNIRRRFEFSSSFDGHARLIFRPLDRPATSADAAAGRAIFSLERGVGPVRVVSLPTAYPIKARWTKLNITNEQVEKQRLWMPNRTDSDIRSLLQTGLVWQAEEVREGERWRRYFGFVSWHSIGRVAAEEIEFIDP